MCLVTPARYLAAIVIILSISWFLTLILCACHESHTSVEGVEMGLVEWPMAFADCYCCLNALRK